MKKKKGCKILFFVLILVVPVLIAARFGTFGPWIGLREQASAPTTSINGIKIYADANNNLCSKHESGTIYTLNSYDPNTGLADPTSIGTLALGSASITDSSGAIDFGDETLSTTNTITGTSLIRPADTNTKIDMTAEDRVTIYGGGIIFADFVETTQDYLYIGSGWDIGVADVDISLGPETDDQAALYIEGSSGNLTIQGDLTLGDANNAHTLTSSDAGTIVMKDDGNDTTVTIGPVADGTTTLGITGALDISGQVDAGNMTLASGSITDSSGAISFNDENLSTSGSITMGSAYLSGYMYRDPNDNNTAYYLRDDRWTLYTGGRTMIDAYETTQDYLYLGYDGSNDIDVKIGPDACLFVEGSTKDVEISDTIVLNGVNIDAYNQSLADDANIILPAFTNGCRGWIIAGDAEAWADFIVDNDGDVQLINNSVGNVSANSDTDDDLCIGTAATQEPLNIKNRLGGAKQIIYKIEYN